MHIHTLVIDRMKKSTSLFLALAVGIVSLSIGFRAGQNVSRRIIVEGIANRDQGKPEEVDFAPFWQAWAMLHENYLRDSEITNQQRVYGAIRGLVGSLKDPYSEFFDPAENKKFQDDIEGNFGGIGAEIGFRKSQLVIIAPLKNTPASRVGLEPGDNILKINTSSTEGVPLDQAVLMIRGPVGTEVTLTIWREGFEKPKEFKIARDTITVPTIDVELSDDGIAHISIHSFNGNLNRMLREESQKALTKGIRGIVVDLRNDPGGFLDVAVDVAGWFMPRGSLVVSEAKKKGTSRELRAEGNAAFAKIPTIVLINQGSASAAEILAGALRDNRNAKLVGEKSFGKGTVQEILDLNDGSTMKITIARWVLPGGQVLENEGLKPDIEVTMGEDIEADKTKKDPQLEKALEVLKKEIQAAKSPLYTLQTR